MRRIGGGNVLSTVAVLAWVMVAVFAGAGIAGTGIAPAAAQSAAQIDLITAEVAETGRYLEFSADPDIERAINDANDRGIAFVWISGDDDAESLAFEVSQQLPSSSFQTTLVLTDSSVGAWSSAFIDLDVVQLAIDVSGDAFARGDVATGIDEFAGNLLGATNATATQNPTPNSTPTSTDSGGIGLGTVVLIALIGGGGFLLVRGLRAKSEARKQAERDLESDRAEIKEQLRDNADHVLNLGDRAISSGKPNLISSYEQASAAYQDVSRSVDGATTAEEIDRLDDKIDHAEWQFESIEAELEGRPAPPSPAEVEAQAAPKPPAPSADGPARGRAESDFGGRSGQQRRYQQPYPGNPQQRRGGGMGDVLGSILGSIVLGGMTGGSRRTQQRRRTTTRTSVGGSRRRSGGSLGGGVLRRGGSGGGRSLGRRRGGGGGRRF